VEILKKRTPVFSNHHLRSRIHEALLVASPGTCVDLNHIDVSGVEDFSDIFLAPEVEQRRPATSFLENKHYSVEEWRTARRRKLNIDISRWDVSKGMNFIDTFRDTDFNGDISKWDVSSAYSTRGMFANASFNGDISGWCQACGRLAACLHGAISRVIYLHGAGGVQNQTHFMTRNKCSMGVTTRGCMG
jgi:Mycoplasma protein of unknown function, DUF285